MQDTPPATAAPKNASGEQPNRAEQQDRPSPKPKMDKFEQEAQALEEELLREEEAELAREKYAICSLKLVAQILLQCPWEVHASQT